MDKMDIIIKLSSIKELVEKFRKTKGFTILVEEENSATLVHEILIPSKQIPFKKQCHGIFTLTANGFETELEVFYSNILVYQSLLMKLEAYAGNKKTYMCFIK